MSTAPESLPSSAWPAAARLVARWLDRHERIDALLDTLPRTLSGAERARCQHLVLGVVRHFGRIDVALGRLVAHPPRFSTRAILYIAGFELIEAAQAKASGDSTENRDAGRVARAREARRAGGGHAGESDFRQSPAMLASCRLFPGRACPGAEVSPG